MVALTLESSPVALKNLGINKKKKKNPPKGGQLPAWAHNSEAEKKKKPSLTCLFGGGRVSLGGFWGWVGGGGVSWRLGLVTDEDVELQRDRFEYPVRGW